MAAEVASMEHSEELSREELSEIILQLKAQVDALTVRVAQLEAENAELRAKLGGGGEATSKPDWVKPNRAERRAAERADRKKRKHSFSRKRELPTEVVEHAVDNCLDCGRALVGGWVHGRRQVIELPEAPVRVIEHVLIARRCGVCGKRYIPKLELSGQVIGNCRLGVRLMSVISNLATNCRMPHRTIQSLLNTFWGLRISLGEISEVLHKVAERGKQAYNDLLWEIRGSPVVNADETGWREDGVNGYIWSFSNPDVRYFLRDQSRASRIVTDTLGDEFEGVLVSDFYGAYNAYGGVKQRCWVHLLRDLKALVDKHPNNESVSRWVNHICITYKQACEVAAGNYTQLEKCRLRQSFETRMLELANLYRDAENAPQRVLAKRIEAFLGDLFTFVDREGVPSDNNAAERAVRPAVISRKVSGGTRSAKGSDTKMTLLSLFSTWNLQGQDPIAACKALLTQAT